MIDSAFSDILKIQGVTGACLFDENGVLHLSALPEIYSNDLISEALGEYLRSIGPWQSLSENFSWNDMWLQFEFGGLLIRKSGEFFVMITCSEGVNFSMLNVALNVVAYKLKKTTSGLSSMSSVSHFSSNNSRPSGQFPANRMNSGISPAPSVTSGINSFSKNSGVNYPSEVPDPVSSDAMKALVKLLAYSIGPVAKPIVKKAARSLGYHETVFPRGSTSELIDSLANEIANPEKRKDFIQKARELFLK